MRVALLFIDGVGIGSRDPTVNPLCHGEFLLSQFDDRTGTTLPNEVNLHRADTTFGLTGRPQSASNQTAIYTGTPAPRRIGGHVLGFPNAPLRALLKEESIVRQVTQKGHTATFANAYPLEYLQLLQLPIHASRAVTATGAPDSAIVEAMARRLKPSASSLAFSAAGVGLRTFDDARVGEGLTHDIDGALARKRNATLPARSPNEAAEIFWRLSADFTLFEHFVADEAGHAQDMTAAVRALSTFDAFAREVFIQRPPDAHVFVCSDHGNVEDLSTRSHTRNEVAVLHAGPARSPTIQTVADVGASVLELLGVASRTKTPNGEAGARP